jgi:hypothetical protein
MTPPPCPSFHITVTMSRDDQTKHELYSLVVFIYYQQIISYWLCPLTVSRRCHPCVNVCTCRHWEVFQRLRIGRHNFLVILSCTVSIWRHFSVCMKQSIILAINICSFYYPISITHCWCFLSASDIHSFIFKHLTYAPLRLCQYHTSTNFFCRHLPSTPYSFSIWDQLLKLAVYNIHSFFRLRQTSVHFLSALISTPCSFSKRDMHFFYLQHQTSTRFSDCILHPLNMLSAFVIYYFYCTVCIRNPLIFLSLSDIRTFFC